MNKGIISIALFFVLGIGQTIYAQATELTFQGQLQSSSAPATGSFDFEFLLFDASAGGSQIGPMLLRNSVTVANGIFSVNLDFGPSFPGSNRFLEIHVRQTGGGAFTTLAPRQPITSTPYSVKSLTADNALQLGGVASNQFVQTNDARLSDARTPTVGSTSYIQNTTSPQAASNFNISGTGRADIFNAATRYDIGGSRVLSISGLQNLLAGVGAGGANTTGQQNAFFGFSAGSSNTEGSLNSFLGDLAGSSNATGTANSFFGQSAGIANTTGGQNAFFGRGAGNSNSTGGFNSFFGNAAGNANTTGSNNTIIGQNADVASGNLNFATAIGAGSAVSTSNTVVLGRSFDAVQVPGNLNVAGTFTGNIDGAGITNLNATQLTSGTLPSARLSGSYSQALTFSNAANSFTGNGAGITNLDASGITSGTVPDANLPATLMRTTGATMTGALNMGNNLITNIGNAGTDFTGTGGLNLAGNLVVGGTSMTVGGNSAFGLARPPHTSGAGTSFSITGQNGGFGGGLGATGGDIEIIAGNAFGLSSGGGILIRGGNGIGGGDVTLDGGSSGDVLIGPNSTVVIGGASTSVILPIGAVNANETLDEPGVASETSSSTVALDGTVETLLSRDITVPTAGFVFVIGTLRAEASHATGTTSAAFFGVSRTAGTLPDNQNITFSFPSAAPTGTYLIPATVHGLFDVAAGTHTFYLLGDENFGTIFASDMQLSLLFVPTSYGTVTSTRPEPAGKADLRLPSAEQIPAEKTILPKSQPDADLPNQIKRQQAEIDELRQMFCSLKPDAPACKRK